MFSSPYAKFTLAQTNGKKSLMTCRKKKEKKKKKMEQGVEAQQLVEQG